MNPERIYRQHRDDALAAQITASEYTTFVAMPFGDTFSYRSREVYQNVIQRAATRANDIGGAKRRFAQPSRVDDHAGTARVITEEIIVQILASHIVVADLSFENAGVLLETGIALGLKSTQQIVLITQGRLSDLHFDIRNNNVISYNNDDSVDAIAKALIAASLSFESDRDKYVSGITRTLSPDAIACLKHYATLQNSEAAASLHSGIAETCFTNGHAFERFESGTSQLLRSRLLWTDWKVKAVPNGDAFGMHATDLGWAVIAELWSELARKSK